MRSMPDWGGLNGGLKYLKYNFDSPLLVRIQLEGRITMGGLL